MAVAACSSGDDLGWKFRERVAKLREAGEPVSFAAFDLPPVPDEDNFAIALEALGQRAKERPLAFFTDEADRDEEDRAEIARWMESLPGFLDDLEASLVRTGFHARWDWKDGFMALIPEMPLVGRVRTAVADWVDDPSGAVFRGGRILRAAGLLDALGRRCRLPFLFGGLTTDRTRLEGVELLHRHRRESSLDWRELRARLDSWLHALSGEGPALEEGLRFERAMWIEFVPRRARRDDLKETLESLSRLEHFPHASARLLHLDALRILDLFDRALEASARSPEALWEAAESLSAEADSVPSVFPLAKAVTPVAARTLRFGAERAARVRLARVALAVMEFRQVSKKWPESLAVLPSVGALPLDPYTRAPFRYERQDGVVRLSAARPSAAEDQQLEEDALLWTWPE